MDTSVINRIFDDQTQVRIYFEATASLLIFMLIEKDYLELVSSEVLIYENENNPYMEMVAQRLNKLRDERVEEGES